VDDENDFESSKRQRLSPLPIGQTNNLQVTHVSVSNETVSSIKFSSQYDHAQQSTYLSENVSATNDQAAALGKKVC
jgi:hypothetical protein